jgi:MYXO-CTERM domain-containing protein
MCSDSFECKSGLCTTSGGSGTTCAASTGGGSQCFYSSGCAAGGEGRPSVVTLLLFAGFIAVAIARARRRRS